MGLGLSLLAAAAGRCEGKLEIATEPGRGTRVEATFRYNHIDRAPVGDMAATITARSGKWGTGSTNALCDNGATIRTHAKTNFIEVFAYGYKPTL